MILQGAKRLVDGGQTCTRAQQCCACKESRKWRPPRYCFLKQRRSKARGMRLRALSDGRLEDREDVAGIDVRAEGADNLYADKRVRR